MRHTVICRQSAAAPTSYTTLELQNVEGTWEWSPRPDANSTFKVNIEQLVSRIAGVPGATLQDITITTRDIASIEADPPLVEQDYGKLVDVQPGVMFSVFAPIVHTKERERFEMWTMISRHAHGISGRGMAHCSGHKYIQRLLGDQIMSQFNAGETREERRPEGFKDFAGGSRNEIWIRPAWQAAELFPSAFPMPKPVVLDQDALANKAMREEFARKKKLHRRGMANQGRTWNAKTLTWSAPK
jgi:hypothetical protein